MYTVYIIKISVSGRRYIGLTVDFDKRIKQHNHGYTKSTATKGSWKLIYKESYSNKIEAVKRERQIKSYKGGNALTKLLGRDGSVVERVIGND